MNGQICLFDMNVYSANSPMELVADLTLVLVAALAGGLGAMVDIGVLVIQRSQNLPIKSANEPHAEDGGVVCPFGRRA